LTLSKAIRNQKHIKSDSINLHENVVANQLWVLVENLATHDKKILNKLVMKT